MTQEQAKALYASIGLCQFFQDQEKVEHMAMNNRRLLEVYVSLVTLVGRVLEPVVFDWIDRVE